jgi:pimeloyl-ACP methyl ester carboxylesterase
LFNPTMTIPLIEHGGRGAVVHLAPANGFPLSCYQPLIDAMAKSHRVVSVPPRALWLGAGDPPTTTGTWEMLADDLLAGFSAHGLDRVIAVGHSFGAVVALLAARRAPDRFRGLVLLDPTLLPAALTAQFVEGRERGRPDWHPLVRRTRERRRVFADRDEAFEVWRGRGPFVDWPDSMLWRYVDGNLRPTADRALTLAWSPEWEVYYFEAVDTDAWTKIETLDRGLPILVLAGASSDTFTEECRHRFARLLPAAEIATIEGGHLFPQSAPEATAAAVTGWLNRLPSGA